MKEKLQALMAQIAAHKTQIIRVGAVLAGAAVGVVVAGMVGGSEPQDELVEYDDVILGPDEEVIEEEDEEPEEIEE